MDTTQIKDDAVKLVSDLDAAIGNAEKWCEKVLTGSLEARVLGGFATEILAGMKALKAEVDAIAQRLGASTTKTPPPVAGP